MSACGAGESQYKHGSSGLSHASGRPDVGSTQPVRSAWRVWARQSRRKPCLYCEPERRRDAVSAAPDVAALDTPPVTHSNYGWTALVGCRT